MYSLPKVLFIKTQQSLKGNGFLISTTNPVVFGKVYMQKDEAEIKGYKEMYPDSIEIEGYNILIIYFRCFGHDNHTLKEIDTALQEMADFYLNEYIQQHLSYHKQFKK
jgi:hypothetical protein